MKAVLDTKPESAYDDDIASRYHFPPRYLALMTQCVGDWVVFRRPRAGGQGIAYFAVGRVTDITPDMTVTGYHYALMKDFLRFDRPVAWRQEGHYAEAALRAIRNVPQVGLYLRGKSVRKLEEADFATIVNLGFSETLDPSNAIRWGLDLDTINDPSAPLTDEILAGTVERRTVAILVNRKIRDAAFRRAVCVAYGDRCAVTGMRIVNGGGRAEVQAAHIVPVASGGPDIVQNGIALSATAHWLFDRHMISITEDYRLLVSHNKVPLELKKLFAPQSDRILLPKERHLWPSETYLATHREAFGGA